jgi:hypothetical protein
LKHLHERNAHALGDGCNVLQDWHTCLVYRKLHHSRRIGQQIALAGWRKAEFGNAVEANAIGLFDPPGNQNRDQKRPGSGGDLRARAFSNCRQEELYAILR